MTYIKLLLAFVPSFLAITVGTSLAYKEAVVVPQLENNILALEHEVNAYSLEAISLEVQNDSIKKTLAIMVGKDALVAKKVCKDSIVYVPQFKKTITQSYVDSDGVFYSRYYQMRMQNKIPHTRIYAIPSHAPFDTTDNE